MTNRKDGEEQPGIRWGPFTFRIPFYHTRVEWSELLQGLFVAGATALGLVPLLTGYFGLTFEEALACSIIHSVLISSAVILFGEPFAPGWITPALPLVLTSILATNGEGSRIYGTSTELFQAMTAVTLDFAVILFVLGVTGLGAKFMRWVPDTLKGGIILVGYQD
jgi:hypothetical protein